MFELNKIKKNTRSHDVFKVNDVEGERLLLPLLPECDAERKRTNGKQWCP